MSQWTIGAGFDESERERIGELYWEVFGRKLRPAFSDEGLARSLVTAGLREDRLLVARSGGSVIGVAGFVRDGVGASDLTARSLRAALGVAGGVRALLVLAPLVRRERAGILVMDGICVAPEARGQGVGTALLDAVQARAARDGCSAVQLSVIDANPRARALYRRCGFRRVGGGRLGPLAPLYGFDEYETMPRPVGKGAWR